MPGKSKGLFMFSKGISPKVNVIAQLEFEPSYFDVTVQHVNVYHHGNSKTRNGEVG